MNWVRLVEPTERWTTARLATLRERLAAAETRGTFGLTIGASCFDELARLHRGNRVLFGLVIHNAKSLVRNRVLRSLSDLSTLEVLGRGRLVGREPFLGSQERRSLWALMRNQREVGDGAGVVAERVAAFSAEEAARRDQAVRELGDDRVHGLRRWWTDSASHIDEWTATHLAAAWSNHLPPDRSEWPPPSDLRALRGFFAYKLGRIMMNVGEGRRVDAGDYFDAEHFACAAYCDYLVTDDTSFRATATAIGRAAPALCSLEDLEELLS